MFIFFLINFAASIVYLIGRNSKADAVAVAAAEVGLVFCTVVLVTGPIWAAQHDPRRTLVGRALRRLSLDELPQLWNIVRGDMSLVGPRAERPNFVAEFSKRLPRYGDRHRVRPGLAGWAQANDLRGQTPVEERLIYDLYYIENWSLAFDLKILLITLARVWTHKNAY